MIFMDKNIILAAIGIGAVLLLSGKSEDASSSSDGGAAVPFNDITPLSASQQYSGTSQPNVYYNLAAPTFPDIVIPQTTTAQTKTAVDPTYGGTAKQDSYGNWQSIAPSSKKETKITTPTLSYVNPSLGYENPYTQQSVLYPSKKETKAAPINNPYSQSIDLKNTYKLK